MRLDRIPTWRLAAVLVSVLVAVAACDSSEPEDVGPVISGVLVANQGNFSDANGSVTAYDPVGQTVAQVLTDLGSTVQSLSVRGNVLFVLSNSANRIEVVALDQSFPRTVIENVLSPRYMAFISHDKAYVSSLFASPDVFTGGKVTVLDVTAGTVIDEIAVGDNPEGIALVGTRAFVANSGFGAGRTVSVIDTQTDDVIATVDVECDGPRFVLVDADQDVWVFCTGNEFGPSGPTNGAVRIISPQSLEIMARIEINGRISTVGPGQDAALAPASGLMYAVRDASTLMRFDAGSNVLLDEIGPFDGAGIGAIAIDETAGRLYLGRVPGFTEAGEVTIHELSGQQIERFQAGVAPTYIALLESQ